MFAFTPVKTILLERKEKQRTLDEKGLFLEKFQSNMTVEVRRAVQSAVGIFSESKRSLQDFYFIRPPVAFKRDYIFSKMIVRGSGFTENSIPLTMWEVGIF